jgi:cytochrome c oxidase subunit 1
MMDRSASSDLRAAKLLMWLYIDTGLAVFALMVLVGIVMRAGQAHWIVLAPTTFYSLMTLHGIGMLASMAVCGMGALWYIMRSDGPLDERVAWWTYGLLVAGTVAVVASVFPGKFGAAWTFLYPLPFIGTYWPSWATGSFLIGLALVTLAFTMWCMQMLGAVLSRYGGLRGAIGWDYVVHAKEFKEAGRTPPPPYAFAALLMGVDGLLTGTVGMVIGVAMFVRWLDPSVVLDPLWAKNLTYFFGHAFANLTIYMALACVYVALSRYTGRAYHTSTVLAVAWWGTLLFVAIAYFHHLYMDFVQPRPLQYIGELASYLSALPTAVVSIFGASLLVYRSGMRWTMGSMFIFAGLIGWLVGGMGALLDATIPINFSLHNTLWVPAHFHTYLLEGVLLFIFGWVFLMLEERSAQSSPVLTRWLVGAGIFGGGAVFLLGFYAAGAFEVPRRYATQPSPGPEIASWATFGALIVLIGLALCLIEAIRLAIARPGPQAVGSVAPTVAAS